MPDGVLGEDKQKWEFDTGFPVIGVYGNQSDRGIEKLGFITLNEKCQLELDAVVEPAESDGNDDEEGVKEVDTLDEPEE